MYTFKATSRKEVDLVDTLGPLVDTSISIQTEEVTPDIERFVTAQLATDKKLSKFPQGIKDEIRDTLVRGAGGM